MLLIPHADAATLTIPPAITEEIALLASQESWLDQLGQCESGGDPTKAIVDTNGYWSRGKYQWQMRSWLNYASLGATKDNIFNPDMQDRVTAYVLNHEPNGWMKWYNCGKKIGLNKAYAELQDMRD